MYAEFNSGLKKDDERLFQYGILDFVIFTHGGS